MTLWFSAVLVAALLVMMPGATTDEAGAAGKGIVDYRLENAVVDLAAIPALVDEMGPDGLGARWTRVLVRWSSLQPSSGSYRASYVAQLDAIVNGLHEKDIKIIMTMVDVPKWASNEKLWSSPPDGYKKGAYEPFYAMDIGNSTVRAEFADVGEYLARRYKGKAAYFECWNEPNLGRYLHPQKRSGDATFGPRTYLAMLRAFGAGVHRGAGSATVIAGATAPRGSDDSYSTTPQTFARYLKSKGGASAFDAYSHHPYTPRGTRNGAPDQAPNNPKRCVTLANLSQLTSLFPSKPFYLTEYGYGTHDSLWFGYPVSTATQARYMRKAYAMMGARRQVKALLWFLVADWGPNTKNPYDGSGAYTGVARVDGTRKPSWYAFAGRNSVTIKAPATARRSAAFKISGVLTSKRGRLAGQTLLLQTRRPGSSAWTKGASTRTQSKGAYSFTVRQKQTKVYRVVWDGVRESALRTVRAN